MRLFDRDGWILCKTQARIFEYSATRNEESSEIFIRRFMNSDIAMDFDSTAFLDGTMSDEGVFESIEEQYGKSSYGKIKYPVEVLYWIGYLYRYFSYTYEWSSKQVYRIIKPKELWNRYYTYHTMDCSVAIERILEEKKIPITKEEINKKLLDFMRKRNLEENIKVNKTDLGKDDFNVSYKSRQIASVKQKESSSWIISFEPTPNEQYEMISCDKIISYLEEYMKLYGGTLSFENSESDIDTVLKEHGFTPIESSKSEKRFYKK